MAMVESYGIDWQAQLANMQLQHHHLTDQVGFVELLKDTAKNHGDFVFFFPREVCLEFSSLHNRFGIFTLKR